MRRFIAFVVILLAGLVLMPTTASASTQSSHWEKKTVYIENHAQNWPIRQAAENLDNMTKLEIKIVTMCPAKVQCIRVYAVHEIPGGPVGLTIPWVYSDHTIAKAEVQLEDQWGDQISPRAKLAATCHELGHAVGLDHSDQADTCMSHSVNDNTPTMISYSESRLLNRWY